MHKSAYSDLQIFDSSWGATPDPTVNRRARLRVLGVVPDIDRGGGAQMAISLLCALDKNRFEVAAVSFYDSADIGRREKLRASGVAMHFLGKRPGMDPRIWGAVRRIVRNFRPDIVHTHLQVMRYVLPSLALNRVPNVIHTVHRMADRDRGTLDRWVHALAFRMDVRPVAVSQAVQESVGRLYGIRDCPLILNGVRLDTFRDPRVSRATWRKQHGLCEKELVYVCVARLESIKNHALILEAFARGPSQTLRSRLLLVGDGELESDLRRQCTALGIDNRVLFLGQRDDIPDILGAADIFVLGSFSEANPLSVIEAFAAGLPVISTGVGGIPELVREGIHGLLVPSGDVSAMSEAMSELGGDPSKRLRLGRAALQRA